MQFVDSFKVDLQSVKLVVQYVFELLKLISCDDLLVVISVSH